MHDALRELTNQLAGRVKNRLLQFQVALRIGLPSITRSSDMRPKNGLTCCFRTLRGLVTVSLSGAVDEALLDYSSAVRVAKEGDFILF